MLNSNNRIKLYTMISTFVIFVIISVMFIFRKKLLHEKNKDKNLSLEQGYGHYTQKVSLGCITENNLCDADGTETFIQKCVPHPDTNKGCFDEDEGTMTYKTITTTSSCSKPCIRQAFSTTFQEDFETEAIATSDDTKNGTDKKLFFKGVNNVIDPYYGIDHTSDYFGMYNSEKGVYYMKLTGNTNYPICIPKNIQVTTN